MANLNSISSSLPNLTAQLAQVTIIDATPTLLGIPIEIRYLILQLLFLVRYIGVPYQLTGMTSPRSAQILAVCRQLHLEGYRILYQEATFDFGYHSVHNFVIPGALRPHLSSIRAAVFGFPTGQDDERPLRIDKITQLFKLKKLTLEFVDNACAYEVSNKELLMQFVCRVARYGNDVILRSLRERMPGTVVYMSVTYLHQHSKGWHVAGSAKFSIEEILDALEGRFPRGMELSRKQKVWLKGVIDGAPEEVGPA